MHLSEKDSRWLASYIRGIKYIQARVKLINRNERCNITLASPWHTAANILLLPSCCLAHCMALLLLLRDLKTWKFHPHIYFLVEYRASVLHLKLRQPYFCDLELVPVGGEESILENET